MTNDEKRAIIEAATPGPWYVNNHNEILEKLMSVDKNGAFVGERPNGIAEIYPLNKQANAKFIAAARTEWPKDLERLKALKELLKDLQWGGGADGRCQYCGEDVCDGHTRDCRIAALLREE